MPYLVPGTSVERKADFEKNLATFQEEYKEFKEKGKKAAGSRAKKSLTIVKKLITAVRRDIQDEIDALKKTKEEPKADEPKA